jgi:hypothetical protein
MWMSLCSSFCSSFSLWCLFLLCIGGVGCDATPTSPIAGVSSSALLQFRCVDQSGTQIKGVPLDECGCVDTRLDPDTGERIVYHLGEVACRCTQDQTKIEWVETDLDSCTPVLDSNGCPESWSCRPKIDEQSQDWIPTTSGEMISWDGDLTGFEGCSTLPTLSKSLICRPQATTQEVVGYLASATEPYVALMSLQPNQRQLLDLDDSIPGTSLLYTQTIVSDLHVHPYGDFVIALQGSQGTLALIDEHQELQTQLRIDLNQGALGKMVVWPPTNTSFARWEDVWRRKGILNPRGYIVALESDQILELDLDRLSLFFDEVMAGEYGTEILEDEALIVPQDLILRAWSLVYSQGVKAGERIKPNLLSLSSDGRWLTVSHADYPSVSIIDLEAESEMDQELGHYIRDLNAFSQCNDSYLKRVLSTKEAPQICKDGVDNDGNGLIDLEDLQCKRYGVEALRIECPLALQCQDGIDNDGNGAIDLDDSSCQEATLEGLRWEGEVPACADGQDNDEDGLIDRADPGCRHELDQSEDRIREVSSCFDQDDNDGDGFIDGDDEDCQNTEIYTRQGIVAFVGEDPNDVCQDELDNDGDGLIDAQDPGCTDGAASSKYSFERLSACSDGIDNDGDGFVDFGDMGDPQCDSASDSNEGSAQVSIGPSILKATSLRVQGEIRSFVYTNTPYGDLVALDLNDPEFKSTLLIRGTYPQVAELRHQGDLSELWLIDQQNTLRTLHLTAPEPILNSLGKRIYLRGDVDADQVALYWIEDGLAWTSDQLDPWRDQIDLDSYTQVPTLPQEIREVIEQLDQTQWIPLDLIENPTGSQDDLQVFL